MRQEVEHYARVRREVQLASGDRVDLKLYEPAMRQLLDMYIKADDSQVLTAFDDLSLIELVVRQGAGAIDTLPENLRKDKTAVAETIENNLRKVITDEAPVNPHYYAEMSELLDALIRQRKAQALEYQAYLEQIVALTRMVALPGEGGRYTEDAVGVGGAPSGQIDEECANAGIQAAQAQLR